MTSPLRRKHRTTARSIQESWISRLSCAKHLCCAKLTAAGCAAILLAMVLIAGQITPAAAADDGFTTPGTRLTWHPVRPERSEDAGTTSAAEKSGTPEKDAEQDKTEHGATKAATVDPDVRQCSADDDDRAPQKLHSVVTARCIDGTCDNKPAKKTSVRLAAGQGASGNSKNSAVALTDPFGDNVQAVRSKRIAMTPPDDIDTLPTPSQSAASPTRIEPTAQDPAELSPPEPLHSGLPKRTLRTYQAAIPAAPAPAPDLLPGASSSPGGDLYNNYPKLPLRNPDQACKEEYDRIKAVTLTKLSIDIVPPGNQAKGDQVPFECGLSTDQFQPRCWEHLTYTWKASALCHKPLYFEQDGLERYGHSWGPYGLEDAQAFVHFFGDLVLLPYNVGVQTPCECDYAFGYYRPGDCAPWICDPFPLSCRGVMTGAIGYCGFAALFP